MAWPISQDYNEAIQSPSSSFVEPELKGGEAVTNAMGMPMPRSGNFADVYEFVGASGAKWALKCFTRSVPGLQERYSEISKHLVQAKLPFTVDFTYLEKGIRIRGEWYPLLKMQWVEGFLLNEFVRNNLDKPALLDGLGQIWLRMAKRLNEANLAHADLQHGNVLLVAGSKASSLAVKLIDYDGMWVPALANKKSGEVGHPNFQHPLRLKQGTYSADVDRLPLLAIACALRCLVVGGKSLWERYDNGDNLLFREADLRNPAASALFKELWKINDAAAHDLIGNLTICLTGALGQVPLLQDLVMPLTDGQEKQVSELLGPGAVLNRPAPVVTAVSAEPIRMAAAPVPEQASRKASPWEALDDADQTPTPGKSKPKKTMLVGLAAAGVLLMLSICVVGGWMLLKGKQPEPRAQKEKSGKEKTKPAPKDSKIDSSKPNAAPGIPKWEFLGVKNFVSDHNPLLGRDDIPKELSAEYKDGLGRFKGKRMSGTKIILGKERGHFGSALIWKVAQPADLNARFVVQPIFEGNARWYYLLLYKHDGIFNPQNNGQYSGTLLGYTMFDSMAGGNVRSYIDIVSKKASVDIRLNDSRNSLIPIDNASSFLLVFVATARWSGDEVDTSFTLTKADALGTGPDPPKNFTNTLGMKFAWIPPGNFLMGSPNAEAGREANETQHQVTLTKGFYMGVYSVTQEEWQGVMGKNPSSYKGEKNLPVDTVSWVDSQEFIKKLGDKDKKAYRLPTEAEWEFAARAGTRTAYYFGNDKSILGQYAWYSENSEKKTHPVGQKKPNQWGLFDMSGNVWQWCEDWHGDYQNKDVVDPQGPEKGSLRVLRGGSWGDDPRSCRSAYRARDEPGNRYGGIGCRVCFCLD